MTGRLNFMHRSWGPLEPFDYTFPQALADSGVYTHMITDHYHYWEEGGATYHTKYDSFEFIRGQEGDCWKGVVAPDWKELQKKYHPSQFRDSGRNKFSRRIVNHEYINADTDLPARQCFDRTFDFLDINRDADDWLLQLETFDPHEPFVAPQRFRDNHHTGYNGPILDWPPYARVTETSEEADELRANYRATLEHCDALLGDLLDYFDAHDMWKDTALVVTTDHGFLLGEHEWWAKVFMPCYNEIAHIPLFVHHPDHMDQDGTRRSALTQSTDIGPTLVDFHCQKPLPHADGHSLFSVLDKDHAVREAAIFGIFGSAVNVTDGRYSYFRYPTDMHAENLYQYTLMPTHMTQPFTTEELACAELISPLSFTNGVPVLRIPCTPVSPYYKRHGPDVQHDAGTVLFDLQSDPGQNSPIADAVIEHRLIEHMVAAMKQNGAPSELFERLGLNPD